jgi:FOG: PKD repeat
MKFPAKLIYLVLCICFYSTPTQAINKVSASGKSFKPKQTQTSKSSAQTTALSASISVDKNSVCQRGALPVITFSGSGGIAPYTFTYTINDGADLTITTSGTETVTLNAPTDVAGKFTYTIKSVTDKDNVPQAITPQSIDIIVNANPTISGATSICGIGNTVQLQGSGTPASTLAWQSSDVGAATINNTGLVTPQNAGQSTITYTDNNGCSAGIIFKVNANPTVNFTFPDKPCAGSPVSFTSTTSEPGEYTYNWDFDDGLTSTEQNPSHFFNATGTGTQNFTVKLTVTNKTTGCFSTKEQIVTVTQSPDASITSDASSIISDGVTVFKSCSNAAATFTFNNASTTISSNNTNYTIDWGDGSPLFTATTWNTATHSYSIGLWTLKYSITGKAGCSITKTYKVFVGSNPGVGIVNPGNTDICKNEAVVFQITGTSNNPPGTTYHLDFGDGSDTTFVHPAPSTVSHTYTQTSCGHTTPDGTMNAFYVHILAVNPCQSTPGSTAIRVSTPPVSNFTLLKTNVCINTVVTISSATTGSADINGSTCTTTPKMIWKITSDTGNYTLNYSSSLGNDFGSDNPNAWVSGSGTIYPTFTTAGTYHITLKAANRCGISIKDTTICVEPALSKPTFDLDKTEICAQQTVNATNKTDVNKTCSTPAYLWQVTYSYGYGGFSSLYTCSDIHVANPSFTFKNPGTYHLSLTVTSACGSITSDKKDIIVKGTPSVSINTISDICGPGSITPSIRTIEKGTPDTNQPTYSWTFSGGTPATSTAANPGTITYSSSNTYNVSLTVSNECGASSTATQSFTVKPVPKITNTELSQTICSDQPTTSVSLTADLTGTTFKWSTAGNTNLQNYISNGIINSIPSQAITNLSSQPQTLSYTITPSLGGCNGTPFTYTITVNPGPSISDQPKSGKACIGETPSALSVTVSNYTGAPAYQWYSNTTNSSSNGTPLTGENASLFNPPGTTAGTTYYYCKINFAGGCSELTTNAVAVTIYQRVSITTQPQDPKPVCVGETITTPLSISVTGGDGTYTYQWYSATGSTPIPSATGSIYTPSAFITPDTYSYYAIVQSEGSGCSSVTSSTINIKAVDKPTIITQPEASQTVCQNGNLTSLQVEAKDGIGTFHYQWYSNATDDKTSGNSIPDATNATYMPPTTATGTTYYYCRITQDGVDCDVFSNTAVVTVKKKASFINEPKQATYCIGETAADLSVSYQDGAGTPVCQWYSTTTNDNTSGASIAGATDSKYKLSTNTPGTIYYYCSVTFTIDGCSNLVSQPAPITVNPKAAIATKTALICSGTSFTVSLEDKSPDIVPAGTTYTWTNPVISPAGTITGASAQTNPQTVIKQTLTNTGTTPATATYTVTPTSGSCTGTPFSVIVTVNPSIKVVANITHCTCYGSNNGAISCTISGGVPFPTDPHQIIQWTGPDGFTATTANISNLKPGTYSLVVSDAGGFPFTNTFTITEPDDIIIATDSKKDITCYGAHNGTVSISVKGGTIPYSFSWTKDGIPYTTSEDVSNLSPGKYEVTVSDKNHCNPKTAQYEITEPTALTVSPVSQTNILCYGSATGAVSVNATGGTPIETSPGVFGYNYLWSGPDGYTSTNQNITDLKAGHYTLNVSDQNGCNAILETELSQNSDIVIDAATTPVTCYGADNASIKITISGGTAPYKTEWSNLATGTEQNNLSAGDYTITVTDANNCQKSATVTIAPPPVFTIVPVVKNISCYGANDGSIKLNIKGKPISVVWGDGSTAGNERNNLKPGTYSVKISDGSPCIIDKTFIITEPQPLSVADLVTDALDCSNANSGSIALTISGGTTPYNYTWSNNASTQDITNIQAGSYNVIVSDANNCTLTKQFTVMRPDPINISINTGYDYNCSEHHLYQIFSTKTTGGIPPYQFTWSSGSPDTSEASVSTDQSGLISVTVKDSRGCSAMASTLSFIPDLGISYKLLDCNTKSYQFDALVVNEATENYSYLWDFGDGSTATTKSAQHQFSSAGIHTVQLTLAGKSCTITYSKAIIVEAIPTLTIAPEPKLCKGDSITIKASGADIFKWNNGSVSDTLAIKRDGDYSVKGTTTTGCSNTLTFAATYYPSHEYPILSDKNNVTLKDPTINLWSDDHPALYYFWNFGDSTSTSGWKQTHTYNITKDGYFDILLSTTDMYGCKSLTNKRIWIINDTDLNTFTPNNDGYNDIFLKGWHLKVYNRNGVLIYEGNDGWDGTYKGKLVSPDTYFYIVYYMSANGTKTKEGYVTVVR